MSASVLTDAKIRGLRATRGERLEHPDTVVPGLRLRVTERSKSWCMRVRAGGKVRTFTLGEYGTGLGMLSLASARAEAIKVKQSIDEGNVPSPTTSRRREASSRLANVIDAFQTRYAAERVKRPEMYRWQFDKYIVPHIGSHDVTVIKRRDLADFLDMISDRHGVTTARRVGGLLKRLFKFAASRDIIENDPAAALMLPGAEKQRERTLTDDELRALWLATDPTTKPADRNLAGRVKPHPSDYPWGAYFRLLLLTGQRRSEVATMKWSALDLNVGTWALEAAEVKSARAHLVPLSASALKLLRALPRVNRVGDGGRVTACDFVLSTNGTTPIQAFSKPKLWLDEAMRRELGAAEVPHWQVHDLRRTVSTNLARLGVDPFVRRRVLNHALTGVDAIYDRYDYLEPKRKALDLWAAELGRIVSGEHQDIVVANNG